MLRNLTLSRPLAVIDLETTGIDPKADRIVEISILKLAPGQAPDHRTMLINPGVPIPAEATAVHGITDADVAGEPAFSEYAPSVVEFLEGCDLCGYNLRRFDLKLLMAELKRAGQSLALAGRAVVDPLAIYHEREKRDLAAALRFYCDRDHDGAHGAAADVLATVAVLDAQVLRYGDLPRTVADLHALYTDPVAVDFEGCFTRVDGAVVFAFGKYKGQTFDNILTTRRDYLSWMLGQDFYEDTKAVVKEALGRK